MENTFGFHYHGNISDEEYNTIRAEDLKQINRLLRKQRILTYLSWFCVGVVVVTGLVLIFK